MKEKRSWNALRVLRSTALASVALASSIAFAGIPSAQASTNLPSQSSFGDGSFPGNGGTDFPLSTQWPMANQNPEGDRSQPFEFHIGTSNASLLTTKWAYTTHGDVSATPTIYNGVAYFPDWGGYLNAVNIQTGQTIWSFPISGYNGVPQSAARTSPVVVGNDLVMGDQNGATQLGGAHVFAVNRFTGKLDWATQVESNPAAVVTSSPTFFNGTIYVGVSSIEESLAAEIPNYPCCTFRGSVVALNPSSGSIEWKTYTVPDNQGVPGGYSGGAVWGSPSIDPVDGLVIVGTGNNYTTPASVTACEQAANPPGSGHCTDPSDFFDSVLALNMNTGAISWSSKSIAYDAFTVACTFLPAGVTWCPSPEGPDYDFGSNPNVFSERINGQWTQVVGIGQKSGQYWLFNAATGALIWHTQVGPGSALGGMMWGSAFDGQRIYVAESNFGRQTYNLTENGNLSSQTTSGGSWAALDPETGKILWQTADPLGASDQGAVTVANGVVYAGSLDPAGHMYAMNASNGHILWSFASGGSVNAGAAVVDGVVYWGSGYTHLTGIGTGNNKLYAFSLPAGTPPAGIDFSGFLPSTPGYIGSSGN